MDFNMLCIYCFYLLGKDTSFEKKKIILVSRQVITMLSRYLFSEMSDAINLANFYS